MSFFKSLICLKGHDDRFRFFTLSIASFICFAFFSVINSQAYFANTVLLLITSAILASTVIRRLHDARLVNTWLPICTGAYLLCGAIIIATTSPLFYGLLLLPTAPVLLLTTYPSDKKQHYILGYAGPVDLSEYNKQSATQTHRIEPSFGTNTSTETSTHETVQPSLKHTGVEFTHTNTPRYHFGEIASNIIANKKVLAGLCAIAFIVIIGIFVMVSSNTSTNEAEPLAAAESIKKEELITLTRNFPIEFSDDFSLMISQHSGLIIHWQADATESFSLWQQRTANGEKSCSAITFNNNNSVRTLSVNVEQNDKYYAEFSPLDTQTLLKELAYRGSFTLCDYKFSLKGSQAVLGKNSPYNRLVSL